jgi:site-specific DNA-methyltransferase (adenine-specific)
MKYIDDKSIDMILCDLPYGTTACKWDNVIPFEPLWEQYERIIKDNGAIVLFGSQPFTSALVMSNPKLFKYELIWKKMYPLDFLMQKNGK